MAEGRGLDDYLVSENAILLPELLKKADEKAGELGVILGRVSRFHEISMGPGSRIAVEVDPETYFSITGQSSQRVNDYLAIVDIKGRLILVRVAEVRRSDLLSLVGSRVPADISLAYTDPSSLMTRTIVMVEPIMETNWTMTEEPKPASSSIEPQSPVIDPKPEVVQKLLGLPENGVLVGSLATSSGLVKGGRIRVFLPIKVFLQHVLIIGTTGSGKTTLIKNMAASAYSYWINKYEDFPVFIFVDLNDDFIQLPFPTRSPPYDDPVYSSLYTNVKPPRGVLVVLPVTEDAIRKALEDGVLNNDNPWCSIVERLVRIHIDESLHPIIRDSSQENIRMIKRKGVCTIEAEFKSTGSSSLIVYVPYTVNTTTSPSSLVSRLMPGLTLFGREIFSRTREMFRRKMGYYPPLPVIASSISSYLADRDRSRIKTDIIVDFLSSRIPSPIEKRSKLEELITEEVITNDTNDTRREPLTRMAEEYWIILSKYSPNSRTLEALYRRILGLIDTGTVDIIYSPDGKRLLNVKEPNWGTIVEIAGELGLPIDIDLASLRLWGGDPGDSGRIIAYRMLERLKSWKHELWAKRSASPLAKKRIIVVIDEAHQFFPQERSSRDNEEIRQIASMISRIARLGRARGIGLVFATHSPRDLHDIILQLANTKIILRTERNQLESIDISSDAKHYIPRLPDRYMVITSFIFRDYIMAATSPPVVMHYDLSSW